MSNTRSLTIRMPLDLYMDLSRAALGHDESLNKKIIQVLRLGLNQHVTLDNALRRLLIKEVSIDE